MDESRRDQKYIGIRIDTDIALSQSPATLAKAKLTVIPDLA
ncbi:hypothetical protein GP2143_15571 [marine gamma proteobacterium HTCC2143]|uniref:Uncharacterized protein n=1 Tax=marine gamma proteobacterium HTCC2143 TaxID=247633 RepID=A0Y984_9GAMM|nr:hypothetical protein GP2143_15571 [marine gamma proteobacterium HTCC2143]